MKYQELINRRILEVFDIKRFFADDLLIKIVNYLDGKIDDYLLDDFVKVLVSDENLLNLRSGYPNVFSKKPNIHFWNADMLVSTMEMLSLTPEQLAEMVRYSINDLGSNNVLDKMVRYLIINNQQLLQHRSNMYKMEREEEVQDFMMFGNIPICVCSLGLSESYYPGMKGSVVFDDLLTRDSLRGLKIGERLFKEMFKKMVEMYPDRDLFAVRVMASNRGGQRFYQRLGGVLFDLDTNEPIDEARLDEYGKENIGVLFTKEIIKKYAYEEIELPTMEDELKRVSIK